MHAICLISFGLNSIKNAHGLYFATFGHVCVTYYQLGLHYNYIYAYIRRPRPTVTDRVHVVRF